MARFVGSHFSPTAPTATSKPCPKCSGSGFFCLGVVNGEPQSNTGFDCYKCHGTGWVTPAPRRQRCPKCGLLWPDIHHEHSFNLCSDGEQHLVICAGVV